MNVQQIIDRNHEAMRLFEKCINTNDLELGRKLIVETAAFKTPVSPTPLYGAEGYLSVVSLMRKSFPAATMITAAVATYVLASAAGVVLRRIPFIGHFIVG